MGQMKLLHSKIDSSIEQMSMLVIRLKDVISEFETFVHEAMNQSEQLRNDDQQIGGASSALLSSASLHINQPSPLSTSSPASKSAISSAVSPTRSSRIIIDEYTYVTLNNILSYIREIDQMYTKELMLKSTIIDAILSPPVSSQHYQTFTYGQFIGSKLNVIQHKLTNLKQMHPTKIGGKGGVESSNFNMKADVADTLAKHSNPAQSDTNDKNKCKTSDILFSLCSHSSIDKQNVSTTAVATAFDSLANNSTLSREQYQLYLSSLLVEPFIDAQRMSTVINACNQIIDSQFRLNSVSA
jgi:hypothetical protein